MTGATHTATAASAPMRLLVAGKLRIPSAPGRLVARPRVEGLIAGLIERHPVVLVTATAGAGKTTAVSQAARVLDRAIAWLTLGDGDVAPGRLLEYLAAAISAHVPSADGLARSALAAGIPHDEVAALLGESIGDEPLTLVVDEVERVAGSQHAVAVLDALTRYTSPETRLVFVSRSELPLDFAALQLADRAGVVDEHDLAFTIDEVAAALRLLGADGVDPETALESTGGWVAGIMFEAWRAERREADADGAADPLHGYLARNIVEELTADERELLLVTSVLQSVTVERAQALGVAGAAGRLSVLQRRHLPASWQSDPLTMRCHPQFREYLLERFTQEGGDRVTEVWRALGDLLKVEGYAEEAVEAFLTAGDLDAGANVAESIIVSIVERLDFDVARRWLAAFAAVPGPTRAGFVTAELLMGMWSTADMPKGVDIGDHLLATGERDELVRSSSRLAALLASCYGAVGRHEDARAVLDAADPSPETDAVRYGMTVRDSEPPDRELPVPELTGGPLDIVILRANYHRGLLTRVAEQPPMPRDSAVEPWRVLAIAALGQTARALERYERASTAPAMWMAGAELMIDLGRAQEARELIDFGRQSVSRGPNTALLHRTNVLEAKLALRCGGDTALARVVLARVLGDRVAFELAFLREHAETWLGLALLIDGDDADAAATLRGTVASMARCGRRLLLPAAAVYLSEAEWRAGDEEAADRAADIALGAAEFQGSNHILLGALHDFPAVAWRRVEAESTADSRWHRFARLLRSPSPSGRNELATTPESVEVIEFGAAELIIDGHATRPRLTKGHTLLALLATEPGCEIPRRRAVEELFDSGTDASTVAYLRLAVRSVRETLPDGIEIILDRQLVRCNPADALVSESVRFETMLANARGLTGTGRLEAFSGALALHGRGPYLDRETSPWAQERRRRLDDLAEEALIQASETAYELGAYSEAERLVRECLGLNRFRESAWRLLMRIAAATCDQDAVIAAYQECERTIAEIGTRPSATTETLLTQLRV